LELLQDSQLHLKTKSLKEIGISFGEAGEYEKAIACFDKAIELNPEDAKAYNNRGLAYANLKQYERAIEDYNKAIKLNPDLTMAYVNRELAISILEP